MSDIVIVGAKRTAIGSFLGQFTGVSSPTLGAAAISAALAQAGVDAASIDEVFTRRRHPGCGRLHYDQ
jgi:acetyl-CoA C-acetyltransferase